MGRWDVQSLIAYSPDLYEPEKSVRDDKLPRHVKFIWITLCLHRPGLASINLEKDFNLLSLDDNENPFALTNQRAFSGGATESEPSSCQKNFTGR